MPVYPLLLSAAILFPFRPLLYSVPEGTLTSAFRFLSLPLLYTSLPLLFTPAITATVHVCPLCPFTPFAASFKFTGIAVPLLLNTSNPIKRGCTDACQTIHMHMNTHASLCCSAASLLIADLFLSAVTLICSNVITLCTGYHGYTTRIGDMCCRGEQAISFFARVDRLLWKLV